MAEPTEDSTSIHDHQLDPERRSERRTLRVIVLTAVTMVVEIAAGWLYGSMALLADGWHMGSHAAALSVTWFAYVYARKHANDPRFAFGTGKVGTLGAFASAIGLGVGAVLLAIESIQRFFEQVQIGFNEALLVAAGGLVINLLSAFILSGGGGHHHTHHHHDHNLRAAYLHVLADALTSVLAIVALIAGKFAGWVWLDAAVGLLGAVMIAHWAVGLCRDSAGVLLDFRVDPDRSHHLRSALEEDGDTEVVDLRVWSVGSHRRAATLKVRSSHGSAADYRARIAELENFAYLTVEVDLPSTPRSPSRE